MKIQLKRSNVLEGSPAAAKEPTADQMEYGELAVNYNTADPAIFIKANDNSIVRIAGVGNIADDGQVEVPSSVAPPSDPSAGNLWFNPLDGRLYVYYDDGNSEQWVDASPDSWMPTVIPDPDNPAIQPGTLDDRYVNVTGDNMTGNLTLGTDKITLFADGSSEFAKQLTVGENTDVAGGTYIGVDGFINLTRPSGSSSGFPLLLGKSGGTETSRITTDGWLVLAGGINAADNAKIGGNVGISGTTFAGGDINLGTLNDSGDYISNSDRKIILNATDGSIKIGGTLPSAPKIELNADGSATFAGTITTSNYDITDNTTNGGVQIPTFGAVRVQRSSSSNDDINDVFLDTEELPRLRCCCLR